MRESPYSTGLSCPLTRSSREKYACSFSDCSPSVPTVFVFSARAEEDCFGKNKNPTPTRIRAVNMYRTFFNKIFLIFIKIPLSKIQNYFSTKKNNFKINKDIIFILFIIYKITNIIHF